MGDTVPESALDHDEIIRRGGADFGDEDFALFKCPACGTVYLLDYEVGTVYTDPADLSRRVPVSAANDLTCVGCGRTFADEAWLGPHAPPGYAVRWSDLAGTGWEWAVPAGMREE